MKELVQQPIYFNDGTQKILVATSLSELQHLVVAEDCAGTFKCSLKQIQSIQQLTTLLATYQLSF